MSFKCGIVGLPNVGKSTLFNALSSSKKAQAENFPFCTIDPNIGIVEVPDKRLNKISLISKSLKTIYTNITFVDIAGLVKGASKGEGLGNKFLSHVREVDAIIHMVRCFESEKIQNIHLNIDPLRDLEIVNTEILLADLSVIEKKLEKNSKKNISTSEIKILEKAYKIISDGKNLSSIKEENEKEILNKLNLISLKPKIIVCNVDENSLDTGNKYSKIIVDEFQNEKVTLLCAEIEQQLIDLNSKDKKNFMRGLGIETTGLDNLIKSGYDLLSLLTFFTSGKKESRAWTIKNHSKAPEAAGTIHSDFKKGFIKAETVGYEDFIKYEGLEGCKKAGKIRLEGKDYLVKDGDILFFRFNT